MSKPLHRALQDHLGGLDRVFFAPSIPSRKLRNARAAHGHHLPGDEEILALYDDTLFGSAEEGAILTVRRICWKNVLEAPQQIAYDDLDPATLRAESSELHIAGGKINISMSDGLSASLRALLLELAEAPTPPARGLEERIRRLALNRLGKAEAIFYAPGIPPKKLGNATRVHAGPLAGDGPPLLLYDDTVFGSAEEGFLLTARTLCWKNIVEEPRFVRWSELNTAQVVAEGNKVMIQGAEIVLTNRPELPSKLALLFREIANVVQGVEQAEAEAPAPAPPAEAPAPPPKTAGFERCRYCNRRVPQDAWISCPGCGAPL